MTLTLSSAPGDGDASAEHELIGATIGNIRIVKLLGAGGMGAVYEGLDERLERRVAVKAIRPDRKLDAEAKARFVREARVLSRLAHPHICQIYEYVEAGDLGEFLVLELIDGRTLDTIIVGELTPTARLDIARQIAGVLVAAHERGVVHRDLKPSNVMLSPTGEVKVLDFGLSRLVDERRGATISRAAGVEDRDSSLQEISGDGGNVETRLGSIIGTLSYMSPEQARGEPAGPASDMFSFGLLLQELLTGGPAYGPEEDMQRRLARAREARTRPITGVAPDLAALVNRLKSLNPGARPSAHDAAERLQWIRDTPRRRLRRRIVAAAITVLTLLSAALAIQTIRIAGERDRAESETAKATAINRFVQETLGAADPIHGTGRDVTLLETLAGAVDEVDASLGDQPAVAAAVRATFGRTYVNLARYDEAAPLLESALEQRRQLHRGDHPEIAASLHDLGDLRGRQGELVEAEELLRESLRMWSSLAGERHPALLGPLMDLGSLLSKQDKYAEAEALHERAVELSIALYGRDDPRVGDALQDLAWTLYRQGRLNEAEERFRRALDLREQALGEKHPHVALTMANLAVVLIDKDELEEAERLVRRCLELRREALGQEHFDVADTLHLLAIINRRRGDLEEAASLLRQAIAIKRNAVGEVHNDVATHLDQLASVLSDQGALAEAEEVQRQALEVYRRLGDEARPAFYATAIQNLAWILTRRGDHAAAEPRYREALAILRKVYAPENWMIANTEANLGACLTRLGQIEEAEEVLLAAYDDLVAALGEDHRRAQKTRGYLDELEAARRR